MRIRSSSKRKRTSRKSLTRKRERFAETLDQGMDMLESAIAELDGQQIPGDVVFKLYDTYGFPIDLTADIARERNLTIDNRGFEKAMDQQRDRARAASRFGTAEEESLKTDAETEFLGYDGTEGASKIISLLKDGKPVKSLSAGDDGAVILSSTPF